ncbi:hypothetical protein [Bradyrhizobium sp. LeoA1S1]
MTELTRQPSVDAAAHRLAAGTKRPVLAYQNRSFGFEQSGEDHMLALSIIWSCPNCHLPLTHVETVWDMEKRERIRIFECGRCTELI